MSITKVPRPNVYPGPQFLFRLDFRYKYAGMTDLESLPSFLDRRKAAFEVCDWQRDDGEISPDTKSRLGAAPRGAILES